MDVPIPAKLKAQNFSGDSKEVFIPVQRMEGYYLPSPGPWNACPVQCLAYFTRAKLIPLGSPGK